MKTLLILRHAKSSWKNSELADHDRPLNKRGKRDAPRMGELLVREGLIPDLIVSSSAKRAKKTTELLAEESGYEGEIIFERDLYAAWPEAYIETLNVIPDEFETVMVVGHNPGLEDLLEILTGEVERMPTAALANVSLPIEHWRELSLEIEAELLNIWRPKEL
jgi:phosphohistidine phosphatase